MGVARAERRRSLRERRDRADAHVLAVEELQPLGERPCREDGAELGGERVLPFGSNWRAASSGRSISSQSRAKNFGSSAPTVRCRASAVA